MWQGTGPSPRGSQSWGCPSPRALRPAWRVPFTATAAARCWDLLPDRRAGQAQRASRLQAQVRTAACKPSPATECLPLAHARNSWAQRTVGHETGAMGKRPAGILQEAAADCRAGEFCSSLNQYGWLPATASSSMHPGNITEQQTGPFLPPPNKPNLPKNMPGTVSIIPRSLNSENAEGISTRQRICRGGLHPRCHWVAIITLGTSQAPTIAALKEKQRSEIRRGWKTP